MSSSSEAQKPSALLTEVLNFVEKSTGLESDVKETGFVSIKQAIDGKLFKFDFNDLNEVLQRVDSEGKSFIQVNFSSGKKVLFTDTLVGFKPKEMVGLDMGKIPRVVTTPDLISVLEAIEESLNADNISEGEVEILKKVYHSILSGGEVVGFDLSFERKWWSRLLTTSLRASA